MSAKDWIVHHAELTGQPYYPLRVAGVNLNCEPNAYGRDFTWSVPMPSPTDRGDRYDFSGAKMDDATRAALTKAGVL